MAVQSLMIPVGTAMPAFTAPDLTGALVTSESFAGAPLLVVFACNHCPYVKHVERTLAEVLARYPKLAVVAICTNDAATYPDDDPTHLASQAARAGWAFPYLIDTTQQIGRDFGAACTPDFFLYDGEGRLAYRGAMDGSTPGNGVPVTGELLDDAIRRVLAGEPVPQPHRPSMGCSIKWRSAR
jgi:thiol-disulfide isomerase/thioredoxin